MGLHRKEWPVNVVDKMRDSIFAISFAVREVTGMPMRPSPIEEAHIRYEDSTSKHAIGVAGLGKSGATDLFLLDKSKVADYWMKAQTVAGLGGFGIYFDTMLDGKPTVMAHLDDRPERTLWLCPSRDRDTEPRTYIVYRKTPVLFLATLSEELANG